MKKLQTKIMKENKHMSNAVGAHCMCPNTKTYKQTSNVPTSNIKPLTSNVAITLIALIITIALNRCRGGRI